MMNSECSRIAGQLDSTLNGEAWYGDSLREILEGVFPGRTFVQIPAKHEAHGAVHVDTAPENVDSVEEVVPQGIG